MSQTDYDSELTPVMLHKLSWLRGESAEEMAASAALEVGRLHELIRAEVTTLRALVAHGAEMSAGTSPIQQVSHLHAHHGDVPALIALERTLRLRSDAHRLSLLCNRRNRRTRLETATRSEPELHWDTSSDSPASSC